MRNFILIFLLLALITFCFAEKVAEFPEVIKPKKILVDGDNLVIDQNQDYCVHIYSLKTFKLKSKIGKKGEGPGEVKRTPQVFFLADSYLLFCRGKLLWFSKIGELIKEMKIKNDFLSIKPIKENYVAAQDFFDPKSFSHTMKFYLLNSETKKMNEIYQANRDVNTAKGMIFKEFKMLTHYLDVQTYKDKIFIGDSRKGFFIDVFDYKGKHLYSINKEIEKVKVSEDFKKKITAEFKAYEKELWPLVQNVMTFYEYFPPLRNFFVEDDRIYATTYKNKDDKHELIILDLKGNILKRVFVPFKSWQIRKFYGTRVDLFYIKDGNLYELIDNEEKELYELHITDLRE